MTVIGHSTTDKVVLFGGLPLLGLAIGFLLPVVADWGARQRWVPFQKPLDCARKAVSEIGVPSVDQADLGGQVGFKEGPRVRRAERYVAGDRGL